MRTTTNNLPKDIIKEIETSINNELIKRGYPTVVATQDTTETRYPKIDIVSEKFNTTPVIFKEIQVDNFGGSITERVEKIVNQDKEGIDFIREVDTIGIWIPVHVSYSHFDGGSNGTSLFTYTGTVFETEDRVILDSK